MASEVFSVSARRASAAGRIRISVQPEGDTGRISIRVRAGDEDGAPTDAYVMLYIADLDTPGRSWTPRDPLSYPALCTRRLPFEHVFRGIEARGRYVGILVSLCDGMHREIDWSCRVFRARDGVEVRDCRTRRR